jgi:H+-transporting ATPase
VEQLKSGIALRAVVIRNGQEHELEARDIVPGDIVVIEVRPLSLSVGQP